MTNPGNTNGAETSLPLKGKTEDVPFKNQVADTDAGVNDQLQKTNSTATNDSAGIAEHAQHGDTELNKGLEAQAENREGRF